MIKSVLFDFDGTLLNTNDLVYKSYDYAIKKLYMRDITKKEFLNLYGRPLDQSFCEAYGEEDGKKLAELYREFNEVNHDLYTKTFEGVDLGIKNLKNKGYSLGIVTSKRKSTLMKGLKLLGLEEYFLCLVTPADSKKFKPDPEPILVGCQKLNIKPEEALYVGDSVFDLQAGKAAGTKICGVKYSLTPLAELEELKPDFMVSSLEELAKLI